MIEILSWANLGTTAGVSAAVITMTQVLKHYLTKVDPKWIALALSMFITIAHQFVVGDYSWGAFALSALNAIMSAGTAIGGYEMFVKPAVQQKL